MFKILILIAGFSYSFNIKEEEILLYGKLRERAVCGEFALVTRRPYCPGGPKELCFTTLSLIPMVSIARLSVVKQSSFGPPGQYGRRVTRVNCEDKRHWLLTLVTTYRFST